MRTRKILVFTVPADHWVKLKESRRRINITTLLENWKPVEHESDDYTNYNWCSRYSHQRINKETEGLEKMGTSRDHQNYCITEIGENT